MLRALLFAVLIWARPALADPALWVVKGGQAPVYLFGSIHLLRPGTAWEGAAIRRAVAASDEFWFEIDMSPGDTLGLLGTTLFQGIDLRHRISDELPAAAAAALAARLGDGLDRVEHMRPWLVLAVLTATAAREEGFSAQLGVDRQLREQAAAAGKPVHGIETGAAQMRLLASMPDAEALQSIEKVLETPPAKLGAQFGQMSRMWLNGDVAGVGKMLDGMSAEQTTRLLTERNRVFAAKVAALARGERTAMVTVGAGHMAGKDGVPALVRGLGLRVERVR